MRYRSRLPMDISNIDLKVVAEGVVTKEQLTLLRRMDRDRGPGYLFLRPFCEGEVEELLA